MFLIAAVVNLYDVYSKIVENHDRKRKLTCVRIQFISVALVINLVIVFCHFLNDFYGGVLHANLLKTRALLHVTVIIHLNELKCSHLCCCLKIHEILNKYLLRGYFQTL